MSTYRLTVVDEITGQVLLERAGIPQMAIDQVARVIAAVLPAAAATRDVLQALRSVGNVLAAHQAEPKRRRRRR